MPPLPKPRRRPHSPPRDVAERTRSIYPAVVASAFRRYSTYRTATIAGVVTNTTFGFIRALVLLELWRQRPSIGGYGISYVATYVFLTQGMAATIGIFGAIDLSPRIRTGDVIIDLFRPLDFQTYWLATDLGRAGYQLLARGVPPFLIGALVFPVTVPTSPLVWLAFLVSVLAAMLLSFFLRYVVALSAFWLFDDRGMTQVSAAITMFFSGFILPIAVFPGWLASIANALPFAGVLQVPIDIFAGHLAAWTTARDIAQQLGWAAVLWLAGRYVTAKARLRLEVQGG